ncbi:putative membrane protein [Bacteroides fragilis str. 1009-4-F |nr:putative membrane protein [Bacteroides fragilis str. 3774 T13]EXY47133.1 putative membrane protein [Bacteroides fragilis str. 3783N1-2]EXZ70868.1 putative membrane protein [Bacteroides fragilis str. 3783N1-8]EYA27521.1 putative membrane protein [Bacteroides fragilis str. 1009-4-F \
MARSYDPLTTLLWILPTSYLLNLITGVISILREKKYPKTEMYY